MTEKTPPAQPDDPKTVEGSDAEFTQNDPKREADVVAPSEPTQVETNPGDNPAEDMSASSPGSVKDTGKSGSSNGSGGSGNRPPEHNKSNSRYWPLALFLILLVVGGVSLWQWFAQQQGQHQFSDRMEAMAEQLTRSEAEVEKLRTHVDSELQASARSFEQTLQPVQQQASQLAERVNELRQQNEQLRQRIDAQQKRLQSLSTTSREDWLLAEAEYLLKLANQRVLLERTPQNAIALLEEADALIKEVAAGTGDAELYAIRKALAEELAALKLVPSVDKEGIYLRLQAFAQRVADLPRVPATRLQEGRAASMAGNDSDSVAEEEATWWQSAWREIAEMAGALDNYIRFDDAETPENPLISAHATQMAALNVRIAIEQAQVALLKEDQRAYEMALQKALSLVDEYYISSEAAGKFRADLQALEGLDVAPDLPDISASLQLLHAYLEQLHRRERQPGGQL